MTTYAVRHAQAQVAGVCYGRLDVEVAVTAPLATSRLIPQLPADLERLYSSPSQRTVTVATRLAKHLGLPVEICPKLMELDFGTWEGRSWDEIHRSEPDALSTWATCPLHRAPPGGETVAALAHRIWEFSRERPLAQALLIAHAGPIRTLRALARTAPVSFDGFLGALDLDFSQPVEHLVVEPVVLVL